MLVAVASAPNHPSRKPLLFKPSHSLFSSCYVATFSCYFPRSASLSTVSAPVSYRGTSPSFFHRQGRLHTLRVMRPSRPGTSSSEAAETRGKSDQATTINNVDLVKLHRFLSALPAESDERELFESTGQREADIIHLRGQIVDEYRTPGGFTLGRIRDHLQFLYLTHSWRKSDDELQDMAVVDRNNRLVKPHIRNVYLPGTDESSAETLLSTMEESRNDTRSSDLCASFLHPSLVEASLQPPESDHPAWRKWLSDSVGIKTRVPLATRDMAISPELHHIVAVRPDALLPLLREAWKAQEPALMQNTTFMDSLRNLPVLAENGQRYPLMETYLPLHRLRQHCKGLMGGLDAFPFLQLPGSDSDDMDILHQWSFLCSDLGVSMHDDVGFLLDVLGRVKEAVPDHLPPSLCRKLVQLYCEVEAKCLEAVEGPAVREIVRNYIEGIGAVLIIDASASVSHWVQPANVTRKMLAATYQDALACTPVELAALGRFFQQTLGVIRSSTDGSVFDLGEEARQIYNSQGTTESS